MCEAPCFSSPTLNNLLAANRPFMSFMVVASHVRSRRQGHRRKVQPRERHGGRVVSLASAETAARLITAATLTRLLRLQLTAENWDTEIQIQKPVDPTLISTSMPLTTHGP